MNVGNMSHNVPFELFLGEKNYSQSLVYYNVSNKQKYSYNNVQCIICAKIQTSQAKYKCNLKKKNL